MYLKWIIFFVYIYISLSLLNMQKEYVSRKHKSSTVLDKKHIYEQQPNYG